MTPNRTATVNDQKIEEFRWNGDMVTYVNNHLFWGTFDDAIQEAT